MKLLVIDDDTAYLDALKRALSDEFETTVASTIPTAQRLLGDSPKLVLLDVRLMHGDPSNRDGLEVLRFIKEAHPEIPVIMMTAYGDIDTAVEAMKIGASDFVQKARTDVRALKGIIHRTLEYSRLKRSAEELRVDLHRWEPGELVGADPKIAEIRELIGALAESKRATVLICGETGTGKELVARAIHRKGPRRDAPFIPVSLSALARGLIESELFGHEKGAFTGAEKRKIGYIERANDGVLFLDEIGELGADLQVKLLRFLDDRRITRVGGTGEIALDLQVISATNRNLEQEVSGGRFREDLYFRLKTFQLFLPPLRERRVDITLLCHHFMRYFRDLGETKVDGISPESLEILLGHPWPGNVRELRSCIERALIYARHHGHRRIEEDDLPRELREPAGGAAPPQSMWPIDLEKEKARFELAHIAGALAAAQGRKTEAWKLLGLNDRFAMRRRVLAIASRYGDILEGFPHIRQEYGKGRVGDGL